MYSFADLISIEVSNSKLRDMGRVQCKYFGTCAGCQYQVRIPLSIMVGFIIVFNVHA